MLKIENPELSLFTHVLIFSIQSSMMCRCHDIIVVCDSLTPLAIFGRSSVTGVKMHFIIYSIGFSILKTASEPYINKLTQLVVFVVPNFSLCFRCNT